MMQGKEKQNKRRKFYMMMWHVIARHITLGPHISLS